MSGRNICIVVEFSLRERTRSCTNSFRENLRIFSVESQHRNNILREKLHANWETLTGEVLYDLLDAHAALARATKKRCVVVAVF